MHMTLEDVQEKKQNNELLIEEAAPPNWGSAPGDDIKDTLAYLSGIRISPQCAGRTNDGFLPEGVRDTGYIVIDDIGVF